MASLALDETTLSATIEPTADSIVVASATGFAVGDLVYIDKEAMRVRNSYVSGTSIPVTRGVKGTRCQRHIAGAAILCGAPGSFFVDDPAGYADTTTIGTLPHVNMPDGNVWILANSQWVQIRANGTAVGTASKEYDYTAAGAITLAPGLHVVTGTTLAMTLASPTPIMNGMVMTVSDGTGSAHTLTYTIGFGDGGSGENVATFSGVKGDSITLRAYDTFWYVVGAHQVTVA